VIVLGERHLRGILTVHAAYYHRRGHILSLDKDSPTPRRVQATTEGGIVALRRSADSTIATSDAQLDSIPDAALLEPVLKSPNSLWRRKSGRSCQSTRRCVAAISRPHDDDSWTTASPTRL
jgi:hypothetical protein